MQENQCIADLRKKYAAADSMTYQHERAWAACVVKFNIVQVPGQRVAYDKCMNDTDPEVKFCSETRALAHQSGSCLGTNTSDDDLHHLLAIYARDNPGVASPANTTDPGLRKAAWFTIPFHTDFSVKLDEPINDSNVSPKLFNATPIRAHIAENIIGEVKDNEVTKSGVAIPAGTEVQVVAVLEQIRKGRDAFAQQLSIYAWKYKDENGKLAPISSYDLREEPSSGGTYHESGSVLHFQTNIPIQLLMSQTELEKRTAGDKPTIDYGNDSSVAQAMARKTWTANNFNPKEQIVLRPSRFSVTVLEDIDLAGIDAGHEFRSRIDQPIMRGHNVAVPAGTELYIRGQRNVNAPLTNPSYALF